jgi:hypothetical protein
MIDGMNSTINPINLFWTGGWDSTFRLLQILVLEQKPVQTYYIIDPNRTSFQIELETMERIRKAIVAKYPFTGSLFHPTKIVPLSEIDRDPIIEEAFKQANRKDHLGNQYDWLARFCKQNQINDMELGVQKLETLSHPPRFSPYMEKYDDAKVYVFKNSLRDEPEFHIFKYFRFPILNLTKKAMFDIAKRNHWLRIMNKTWFCHEPIGNKIPCGKCVPCQQIIDDKALKRRVPFYIRFLRRNPRSILTILFDRLFFPG